MTTHLHIRNGFHELNTYEPHPEDLISFDYDFAADFDYVLATIQQVVERPAYEWNGVDTMKLVVTLGLAFLDAHGESIAFGQDQIDAIKEANQR